MAQVTSGDLIDVHYTGKLEDGTVFDSSQGGEPLTFVAGGEDLISGFSQAVVGMEAGASKTVKLEPADAYGERRDELLQKVPTEALPDDTSVGDRLQASTDHGDVTVQVVSIEGEEAVLDANHPLAGQTLVFEIAVERIHPPEEES